MAPPPRQPEQQVSELLAVVGVAAAAVEGGRVQWVGLRVEDVAAGAQDALAALAALLPGRRAQALAAVQEVGGVKEEVEVLDGLGEEERLHPVVQLVISHVFDLRVHNIKCLINNTTEIFIQTFQNKLLNYSLNLTCTAFTQKSELQKCNHVYRLHFSDLFKFVYIKKHVKIVIITAIFTVILSYMFLIIMLVIMIREC